MDDKRDISNSFRVYRSALLVLIVVGAGLRLYCITSESIWYDEAATLFRAASITNTDSWFNLDYGFEPLLLPFLARFWHDLGLHFFALTPGSALFDGYLRLLPFFFSVLCIPVLFYTAYALVRDARAALASTAIITFSPFHVYYAHELRAYSLITLLGLGAVWFMVHALDKGRLRDWTGLVVCLVLSMYNHYQSLWTLLTINMCFAVVLPWMWRKTPAWTLSQIGVLLLAAPTFWMAWHIMESTGKATSWYAPLSVDAGLITFKNFLAGYSSNYRVYRILTLMGAALLVGGIWHLRKQPRTLVWLLILGVVPIASNVFLCLGRDFNLYQHRSFIFSSTMLFVVMGAGVTLLYRARYMALVMSVLLAFMSFGLYDLYHKQYHPDERHRLGLRKKVPLRDAAHDMLSEWSSEDLVAHNSTMTLLPFRYLYVPGKNKAVVFNRSEQDAIYESLPSPVWEAHDLLPYKIDALTRNEKRVWLIASWWEPHDTPMFSWRQVRWLDGQGIRLHTYTYDGLWVYFYDMDHPPRSKRRWVCLDEGIPEPVYTDWDTAMEQTHLPEDVSEAEMALWLTGLPRQNPQKPGIWDISVAGQYTGIDRRYIALEVFVAADRLEPLDFLRENPEIEGWVLSSNWIPPYTDRYLPLVWTGRIQDDTGHGEHLYAWMRALPGKYDVLACIWHGQHEDADQAGIRVRQRDKTSNEITEIGTFFPEMPDKATWIWSNLGEVESDGTPVILDLELIARNANRNSRIDIGTIVLLQKAEGYSHIDYGPCITQPVELELDGTFRHHVEVTGQPGDRVDITFHALQFGLRRTVTVYLIE